MELVVLAKIAGVLCLGAVSPGPSLAVVLRNTFLGGRARGVACSIGHGLGFGLYAFVVISLLTVLMESYLGLYSMLQLAGAAFLAFMGVMMFRHQEGTFDDEGEPGERQGFVEGFLTAFLNPKILAFHLAVLSQFLPAGMTLLDKLEVCAVATVIDGGWYIIVAVIIAGTPLLEKMRQQEQVVSRAIGALLILIAGLLLFGQGA